MGDRTTQHESFEIERTYDGVSAKKTFSAWSSPEARRNWEEEGDWSVDYDPKDFRPGGREATRFSKPDGTGYSAETVYQDIVENERIVMAYTVTADGKRLSASLATVEFLRVEDATRLIYTEQATFLDGGDTAKSRRAGVSTHLDQLAEYLQRELTAA